MKAGFEDIYVALQAVTHIVHLFEAKNLTARSPLWIPRIFSILEKQEKRRVSVHCTAE